LHTEEQSRSRFGQRSGCVSSTLMMHCAVRKNVPSAKCQCVCVWSVQCFHTVFDYQLLKDSEILLSWSMNDDGIFIIPLFEQCCTRVCWTTDSQTMIRSECVRVVHQSIIINKRTREQKDNTSKTNNIKQAKSENHNPVTLIVLSYLESNNAKSK